MKIVTTVQMKEMEKRSDEAGVSYLQLMKNAGRQLGMHIENIMEDITGRRAVFLSGSGNNGGDCFIAAEYLRSRGFECTVALVCGVPKTDVARTAFSLMNGVRVLTDEQEIRDAIEEADIIADGIFGTGFHGELESGIASLLNAGTDAVRVAVDVPSGGNAVTGSVSDGCFRADYTVTFGCVKFGMTQYPLKSFCGHLICAEIGIPDGCGEFELCINETDKEFARQNIIKRKADSHKGTYGTLVSVTGSRNMPGAAILSGKAALRSGLGLLKQCTVPENTAAFAAAFPEPVYVPLKTDEDGFYSADNADSILNLTEKAGTLLIGCGLGTSKDTAELVKRLIREAECRIVLDADGLNCIADCPEILNESRNEIIITPHPAEAARLLGVNTAEIQRDRLKSALEFAERFPHTVTVLKGAGTVIAYGNEVYVNPTGNPGMSTGGSGDVLAGIIASLVSQGVESHKAAVTGAWIHGAAGDRAAAKLTRYSMLPSDIISELPAVFAELG